MWAEYLNLETVESRVWPRTMAVAERLWSPQSKHAADQMHSTLRLMAPGTLMLGRRCELGDF